MVETTSPKTRRRSLGTPRKIFGEGCINVPRNKESKSSPRKKLHREESTFQDNPKLVEKGCGKDSICGNVELAELDDKKMKFKMVCEFRVGEDVDDTLCDLGIQEWSVEDFGFLKLLGKGGSGTIFRAAEKESGYEVALKVQKADSHAICELDLHQSLNHPNIVKMYDYFYSTQYFGPPGEDNDSVERQTYLYLILELCEGGSLYEGIIDDACDIDDIEEQAAIYFIGALNATEHLHDKGIIHCDMKSGNILVHKRRTKLADFGMAVYSEEKEIIGGSAPYMSPEYLMAWRHMSGNFDHRVDIYGLGVILYEMLCGFLPYKVIKLDQSIKAEDDLDAYIDKECPILDLRTLNDYASDELFCIPPPIFSEEISELAQDLVLRLMEPNMEKRMSLAEAKEHPWLKQYM